MSEIQEVAEDLAAFADDEASAVVGDDGSFIVQRNGVELAGTLVQQADGNLLVEINGTTVPYLRFLTHDLARMDVLAQRLLERRPHVAAFVDADVRLQRAAEDVSHGRGLSVLNERCSSVSPFSSRVIFVTADAGHGKTALLREHQAAQATRFLSGQSQYLFWHLDLQGRQLLRLSEALMGDLADLRLAGLWMPAVIRLMRRGALVIGVDGFDELAAEQGGVDALGALASLVSQLRGHGVVVAASRRTFFNTDDYLRRGGMVRRGVPDPCQFDELELVAWGRDDVVTYFKNAEFDGARIADPSEMYEAILSTLGGDASHPILTRPFLITQVAKASMLYGTSPEEFLRTPDDPYSGVASVVNAFVRREVAEKWKVRETGEPYLSESQHLALLADVAEEMHRSQRDRLDVEIIETIAAMLLEQWSIDSSLHQQIIEMVRMHVLLVAPPGTNQEQRMFDHPEFRDYFVGFALRERITGVMSGGPVTDLVRFLSISQLSDSTARYVCSMIDREPEDVNRFLRAAERALADEWKPTYLQQNLGTLIPFLIDGVSFEKGAGFAGKAIYSSLAFEGSVIKSFTFSNGTFVNVSLRGATWTDVVLEGMALGELQVDRDSSFTNVCISASTLEGVRIQNGSAEETREYAPARVRRLVEGVGLSFVDAELDLGEHTIVPDSNMVRLLRKLLRMFQRTTIVADEALRVRFGTDFATVEARLMPLLAHHEVVEERKWRGSGAQRAWALVVGHDDFLAAEGTALPHGEVWRSLQEEA